MVVAMFASSLPQGLLEHVEPLPEQFCLEHDADPAIMGLLKKASGWRRMVVNFWVGVRVPGS